MRPPVDTSMRAALLRAGSDVVGADQVLRARLMPHTIFALPAAQQSTCGSVLGIMRVHCRASAGPVMSALARRIESGQGEWVCLSQLLQLSSHSTRTSRS